MSEVRTTTREMTTRPMIAAVIGWVLYDFADTNFSMNIVSLYFTVWVVNVMGGTDGHYGIANDASMAVILILSPLLGALTDQTPRRMPFLIVATIICVGFTAILGSVGLTTSLIAFALANIGYQAGLQFYDALLPEVSTEENRGRISGIGIGVGYLGSFLGVTIGGIILAGVDALPIAEQTTKYTTVFQISALL